MSVAALDPVQLAYSVLAAKIHAAAATTVLAYDCIMSFEDEVELIWFSPNTLPKYLYFISRYVGLATLAIMSCGFLDLDCEGYIVLQLISLSILVLVVQLSMVLRLYALYQRNTYVRWLLCIAYVLQAVSMIVLILLTYPTILPRLRPYPADFPFRGCFVPKMPVYYKGCWLPPLAFEALMFVLNTAKCLSYRPLDNTPLILRLLRDGSLYFTTVFAGMMFCSLGPFLPKTRLGILGSIWVFAIYSFSGARLLLSVRSLVNERDNNVVISSLVPDISSRSRSKDDHTETLANAHENEPPRTSPSPTETHELMWWPPQARHSRSAQRESEAESGLRSGGAIINWMVEWEP